MYKRLWVSNFKLREDEKELKKYRDHLEETVKERTKHLIETKEEAIRANAAKTEFLARMSHELRTPLNAVLGFGQLLEMDGSINDAQKSHVKDIIQAGRHLLDLIDEVLDLTSIESGSISVTIEPVSLSQTVFESIATVKPLAQKKGIQIENKVQPGDEINVLAAKTHLKEVLLNLLSNAIKYGRENGHINLCTTVLPDNCIKLEIIDDGRGIDIKAHAMVFEPFARLGAEYTEVEGTGIGLTISKRLIELMGGEIGFTSVKNEGCTFYIQLPLSGESAKVPDTPESANRQDV
jgi:signal transduction histidine kinase